MQRRPRNWLIALGTAGAVLVIGVVAVIVLTQTDWGRRRVLGIGLGQLASRVHGDVRVAGLHGNLLTGARLNGVVITDTAGRPFLSVDTLTLRYSLRSLLRQHLVLSDVRLVNGVIVLDQPPGEEWNYARIFPLSPEPRRGPGFGSWVYIDGMTVRNLTAVVRAAWTPPAELEGAARRQAAAEALTSGRKWIVPVGTGYQSISQFFDINGRLPAMRLADPDSATRLIVLSGLSMFAVPFRPPGTRIHNLSARLGISKDTLFVDSLRVRLPGTRASGVGAYALDAGGARLQLTVPEADLADARFLVDGVPAGRASLQVAITTRGERAHVIASNMDVSAEGARIRGFVDVELGAGAFQLGPSDVTYANVGTQLIQRLTPAVQPPAPGTLAGHLRLQGVPTDLSVDGWTTYNETRGPTSRIVADGRIGSRNGAFTARGLRLRFEPLQMTLVRSRAPQVPYGGVVTGTTTLTGSTRSGFTVTADLAHDGAGIGRSHVTAAGRVQVAGGVSARALRVQMQPLQVAALRPFVERLPIDGVIVGTTTLTGSPATRRLDAELDVEHRGSTGVSRFIGRAHAGWAGGGDFDVNVRTPALSLATVGTFAPQAGLHGSASGRIAARGNLARLTADAELALAEGQGSVHTRGGFDLAAVRKRYDFTAAFTSFNAAAATTRLPASSITGDVVARGAGTDPATAAAVISAHLIGSRAAGAPVLDTTVVNVRIAEGLARVDTGRIRFASMRADVGGSFGLAAHRSGTLRYAVTIDTLADFSPATRPDTLAAAHAALAGWLQAEGTLAGNIKRFDVLGTAVARGLTVRGNYAGSGEASYTLTGIGTPDASVHIEAAADTLYLGRLALDSARATLDYTGERSRGSGAVDVAIFQEPNRDYTLQSNFDVAPERKQATVRTLALRFDTTHWTAPHPATVDWGRAGTVIGNLELHSNTGGYLRADGRLPTEGAADLTLDAEGIQLADLNLLLRDTSSVAGLLELHARVRGATSDPVITGDLALAEAAFRGNPLPDVSATLNYSQHELTTHAELHRAGTPLAVADARLPVNLSLTRVAGPRLQRAAPLTIDVRADSLPLDALPSFTTAVTDVRGRVHGNATVRGTLDEPDVRGDALLDLASLRVAASGVRYRDAAGSLRLRGDTAYVDSLVAYSGGMVRTAGTLSLAAPLRPAFDLSVTADDAWLLNNEKGRIRADAELAVAGPYDALRVSGAVTVKSGVIYVPETRSRRVTNLDDPTLRARVDTAGLGLDVLPPPNPMLQNLVVDVALRIEPDTWARNTQLNVELFTPPDADALRVHMDNAHQVLTLEGVINADRGEYAVAGRSLELSTGSATFLGGPALDPLIELTARYQVQRRGQEALIIEVHVDGPLTEPRVTLQSNAEPPLAQSDLLAYLAFGQPSSSLTNSQSTGAAVGNGGLSGLPALAQQQIASVAIGATVDEAVAGIERRGTRSGLDVFRVNAGELPAEAAFEGYFSNIVRGTEVEAGKYVSNRFFVAARGRASTYPGVSVEYRNPIGLTWRGVWEPRYRPAEPSLETTQSAGQIRSLGVFLLWNKRF